MSESFQVKSGEEEFSVAMLLHTMMVRRMIIFWKHMRCLLITKITWKNLFCENKKTRRLCNNKFYRSFYRIYCFAHLPDSSNRWKYPGRSSEIFMESRWCCLHPSSFMKEQSSFVLGYILVLCSNKICYHPPTHHHHYQRTLSTEHCCCRSNAGDKFSKN